MAAATPARRTGLPARLKALRPADRLEQVRLAFLAFCLGSWGLVTVVIATRLPQAGFIAVVAMCLAPLVAVRWIEEYRGRGLPWPLDVAEGGAFLAAGVATGSPPTIIALIYVRLALGATTASGRRAAVLTTAFILAFAGAVVLTSPHWGMNTQTVPYLFLASAFCIVAPVMRMLAAALAGLNGAMRRDRALRDVMTQLGAAIRVDDVRNAAEPALRRLVGDASLRVRIVNADRAAPLATAQREQLHRNGLTLQGDHAGLLWPDGESPPSSVFAMAMSTTGLVVVETPPLPESTRTVVVTFVEHLSIHLEAAALREIGERRRIDAVVRESEEYFRHIFERNPQPMWIYEVSTQRILAVNDAAIVAYGYSRSEFLAMRADALAVEDAPGRQHRLKNGREIDVEIETGAVVFQGRELVLLVARDVTEQRVLQERLEHNALHDPLTGLPNKVLLRTRTRRAVARSARNAARRPAMLVLDLDGFKTVNDTLGHALGDRVIAIVGARLARSVKSTDTASRLGGAEFAVLLEDAGDADEAAAIARRLITELRRPITLNGQRLTINASAGVSVPRPEHRSPEDLLGDADIAMSIAKGQEPGACVVFDPSFREALLERLALQRELSDAVNAKRLGVVYQPQVDLRTGRVVAVEALVRWPHPERGYVPPDVFIPIAEQTGVVTAIDAWVLRTACTELRGWLDSGLPPMRMAVNISGRDLEREDLVATVRAALRDSGVDPWRLELELTETAAVSQPETAILRLQELRAMGVHIAIDDFGTGFSMFSRLRDLPIDRLKIDRSFVTDLSRDDDARTIVGSTVQMAHALGLDLVAEGVEGGDTADILRDLGCDGAQGYHFAAPLGAAELCAWVRSRSLANVLERQAV